MGPATGFAFLTFLGAGPSPDPIDIRTHHLSLSVDPATGGITLRVPADRGATVHEARVAGLYLDGIRQTGFQVVAAGPAPELRNASLELSFEVVDDRSIAARWTARDGRAHAFELELLSDDETRYYGTGERFNALDQRGYILPMITDDRYGNKGVGAYKPVPFVMSSRGFGLWVDGWAPGVFDLSATGRFSTRLRFETPVLRVVFIGGPRMADVLESYTGQTGRPPVPPPWAFGLWKSRDVHHDQDSVRVDVERLRELDIPASVLVIDSPWETGYNDFVVNRRQFPDPGAMFALTDSLGFRSCLWLTPFVNARNVIDMAGMDSVTSTFDEAVERGVLVEGPTGGVALSEWWKGEGGLVDFTHPEAVRWWHDQLAKTREYDVRCFKADDGEGNFVPDAVFHDGTTVAEMKNGYSVLYNAVMQAYVDSALGGDGVLLTRSGYTGTQRYPFSWAGDNRSDFSPTDGLPSVVIAGQNAAFSGIALWGSDIAGYAGTPSKEVFLRWTQFATFTPLMQIHMTSNLGPWDFGEEALAIFRDFARLRIRLFPYLYDAVHEAAATGMPVIRPMALVFQDDPEAAEHVDQYLFGPDLLVAPVVRPVTGRAVYLPAGVWYDYWSGARHEGPRILEVEAPLARIPLFVRAGAIIPMLPEGIDTLIPRHPGMAPEVVAIDERRVLQVWPGESGSVDTWDGIRAALERHGDRATLRVASDRPRPVEIRLLHRGRVRIEAGVTARHDVAGTTVIAIPDLEEGCTLTWTE